MDLCENVSCSNGFCVAGTCDCDFGYVNIDNVCAETCDSNPCEVLILVTDRLLSINAFLNTFW